jgi:hypothetical protein
MTKAPKLIHTFEQYRARYFPQEVERERIARLTPEERGAELAQQMLKSVSKSLRRSKVLSSPDLPS